MSEIYKVELNELKNKGIMEKENIRKTHVYVINGQMVVANSIEGAINTWREWNRDAVSEEIECIRILKNDYPTEGYDTIVFAEGLCGDITNQYVEEIARMEEDRQKMKYELEKLSTYCNDLERRNQELQCAVGNG